MDGPWVPTAQRASIFTVVIYLNDAQSNQGGFTGGETNFLQPLAHEEPAPDGHPSPLLSRQEYPIIFNVSVSSFKMRRLLPPQNRSLRGHDVLCSVTPKTGNALLFKHELLHEVLVALFINSFNPSCLHI